MRIIAMGQHMAMVPRSALWRGEVTFRRLMSRGGGCQAAMRAGSWRSRAGNGRERNDGGMSDAVGLIGKPAIERGFRSNRRGVARAAQSGCFLVPSRVDVPVCSAVLRRGARELIVGIGIE